MIRTFDGFALVLALFCFLSFDLVLNVMDSSGNTPLHWATKKNQVESVSLLLSRGANPNILNSNMMAPLHMAVQSLHNEIVKVSLKST